MLFSNLTKALSVYKGHRYVLVGPLPWNHTVAERTCEQYGGYLVEVDDDEEYNFLVSFLKDKPKPGSEQFGFISGTAKGHEGSYVFQHSGKPVTFFKWASGEPDRIATQNYLSLDNSNIKMYDLMGVKTTARGWSVCEIE